MTSIAESVGPRRVAIGIDTHKFIHVAVALDELGTILDDIAVSVDQGGYARLLQLPARIGAIAGCAARVTSWMLRTPPERFWPAALPPFPRAQTAWSKCSGRSRWPKIPPSKPGPQP